MMNDIVWWTEDNGVYSLHFQPFYKDDYDEIIAQFDSQKEFVYVSDMLKVEFDYLESDNVEDAKEEIEDMVQAYFDGEADYYDDLSKRFKDALHSKSE